MRFGPKRAIYIADIGAFVSYIGVIGNIGAISGLGLAHIQSVEQRINCTTTLFGLASVYMAQILLGFASEYLSHVHLCRTCGATVIH